MIKRLILLLIVAITLCSCENYSKGERIGMITKFSNKGVMCKSWEGHLNATQTGMNSSEGFDFSIDNDMNDVEEFKLVSILDSATNEGWKVKLKYHETFLKNLFSNRGETDYFVNEVVILDRNMVNNSNTTHGRIVDTIYVVINKSKE